MCMVVLFLDASLTVALIRVKRMIQNRKVSELTNQVRSLITTSRLAVNGSKQKQAADWPIRYSLSADWPIRYSLS